MKNDCKTKEELWTKVLVDLSLEWSTDKSTPAKLWQILVLCRKCNSHSHFPSKRYIKGDHEKLVILATIWEILHIENHHR
jgi:hypothetical protein